MKKITKRDLIFFFLGLFTFFVFEAVYDWEDSKRDFLKGYNDAISNSK